MTAAEPRAVVPRGARASFVERRRDLVAIAVLGAVLFLTGLGSRDLWNPDEPRYAEVAREMLAGGDLAVPHLNGEVYAEKPPLFFWLVALAGRVTGGLDEVAVRLPSALAAIGAMLLVYHLGRLFFSRRAAWLAVAAYGTCVKVLWQGRVGQIDMTLGVLVLAAVACWATGWVRDRPALGWAFFALAGAATVAKGPVGLLPPLLSIVALLAWERDWAALRRLRVGRGLVLWAAVVLLWLAPAVVAGGQEYFETIVFKQNVTRYADPWHHHQPWYYYLTVLPGDFFPWSLLLPGAALAAWRGARSGAERRGVRLAIAWVLVTILFFSLSPAKRTVYVLSMYPGLALLVGFGLAAWQERAAASRRWVVWPLAALAALLAAAAAVAPWRLAREEEVALVGRHLPWVLAGLLALLAVAATTAAVAARRGRATAAGGALAAGMGVFVLGATLLVLPAFDPVKSAQPLAEQVARLAPPGAAIGIFPEPEAGFLFYSGRRYEVLHDEEELRRFVAREERVVVLAERDDLARLSAPPPLVERWRDPDPEEGFVVLVPPPVRQR